MPRVRFPLSAHASGVLRESFRALRATPVWAETFHAKTRRGPCLALLPSRGRSQSSLLRIYNVSRSLRALGWRTVVLPWRLSLAQRHAILARLSPDLVLMQGARHELNRPALYPGLPIVYDMDDADFHLPHLAGPVRRAMPAVEMVIAGSAYVADWCIENGASAAKVAWTGTPVSGWPRPRHEGRPPVVAWAQTRPDSYVREADLVIEVMERLKDKYPGARLRLYDRRSEDDPTLMHRCAAAGIDVEWLPGLSYRDYLRSFDDVSVGLAPLCTETPFSRGKSFGKVLGYLDRKVPVIASDACEHGRFFTPGTGVITNSSAIWADALATLLRDADLRQRQADAAFSDFQSRLSLNATAQRIDRLLSRVLDQRQPSQGVHFLPRLSA